MRLVMMLFLATFWLRLPTAAQSPYKAEDLIGQWYVEDHAAITEFFVASGKYVGRTTWLKEPNDINGRPKIDKNNPDKTKKTKPLLGAIICMDFVYSGEGVWSEGSIYDARSGKTYSCKITMKDKDTISVRGYVGISLIGASTTWTRKKS